MAGAFIDTNIAIYAFTDQDLDKQAVAHRLLADLLNSHEAVVSTQVLAEFANTALGKLARQPEVVKRGVRLLSAGRLVVLDHGLLCEAIDVRARYQVQFWDACILAAAAQAGCRVVYSEDLNAGQWYGSVQVLNPFAGESPQ